MVQAYSPLMTGNKSNDEILAKFWKKYGKSWAQVLIKWSLQVAFVAMLKSVTPERIIENIKVDFELDGTHMERLDMPGSYEYCT